MHFQTERTLEILGSTGQSSRSLNKICCKEHFEVGGILYSTSDIEFSVDRL